MKTAHLLPGRAARLRRVATGLQVAGLLCVALLATAVPTALGAQTPVRESLERIPVPPLRFPQVDVQEHRLSHGTTVFFASDPSLPLVSIFARFEGGYARFPRDRYAAGTALPSLLRNGGTRELPPDSVERILERYAIQTTFGGSGNAVSASVNTLTRHLDTAVEVWTDLLARPRFDTAMISVWRIQSLENARRRRDDMARLAYSEFNRLMYGDHPVGWEMGEADLAPERMRPEDFHYLHRRITCRENLILGVTGDLTWREAEPIVEGLVSALPSCAEPLPEPPDARVGAAPGVYLIPREVNQSTVVLAQPTSLRQGATREYFASRIGNTILGAGGFSSRLLARIRTREGLAYGASSIWTAPRRYDGLLGATTRTRSETTVPAIRLILETLREMGERPPTEDELRTTVDQSVNGFVFNFQSPAQVVSRRIAYRAADLPDDWLQEYLAGIQTVSSGDVQTVFQEYLDPERMVILVVGNPAEMPEGLESLGPVTVVEVELPSDSGAAPTPAGSPPRSRLRP